MNNADVSKIIIEYEDGTKKELEQGAVVSFRYDEIDEEHKITIEMCEFKRKELEQMIFVMIKTGQRLGMFNDIDESEA